MSNMTTGCTGPSCPRCSGARIVYADCPGPAEGTAPVSADDVRAVAAFLRMKRDKAVRGGRGVMLSWDDANGFALVLDAAADGLAARAATEGRGT